MPKPCRSGGGAGPARSGKPVKGDPGRANNHQTCRVNVVAVLAQGHRELPVAAGPGSVDQLELGEGFWPIEGVLNPKFEGLGRYRDVGLWSAELGRGRPGLDPAFVAVLCIDVEEQGWQQFIHFEVGSGGRATRDSVVALLTGPRAVGIDGDRRSHARHGCCHWFAGVEQCRPDIGDSELNRNRIVNRDGHAAFVNLAEAKATKFHVWPRLWGKINRNDRAGFDSAALCCAVHLGNGAFGVVLVAVRRGDFYFEVKRFRDLVLGRFDPFFEEPFELCGLVGVEVEVGVLLPYPFGDLGKRRVGAIINGRFPLASNGRLLLRNNRGRLRLSSDGWHRRCEHGEAREQRDHHRSKCSRGSTRSLNVNQCPHDVHSDYFGTPIVGSSVPSPKRANGLGQLRRACRYC